MGSATIRDVARRAEVSVASVSRALNGHENVHPDTRARVREAAAALGYVPHAGARSLSLARTQAIGIVLPDLYGEFFSEIVRGMDRETSARGYHLLLSNMHADAALAALAMRSMRGRVDGLIVMAPQLDDAGLDAALPPGLPTVLINAADGGGRPLLRVDNATGIAAAMRHLAQTGRRAPVHVAGPDANIDGRERRAAYVAAMARHFPDAPVRVVAGDFTEEAGARAVAELRAGAPFDAVVAANDMMALGALHALRDGGVDVPRDVAVTGFDDVPLARYLSLTTVHVDLIGLGSRAVARLVDRLTGAPADDAVELIATDLVVRASSATPERTA
ncbi:LacI family transcriptional regulator [Sphingomonas sp. Leaf412]|uniref:LacI family DNA-binding transcriptional regulator n=1 Tax=Sphingomonas sp. Leaf412 TaxID=1736370 RepID=UPI0006FB9170|nr:LacI family DNA-binding transcriptional regulator [Sphingomonas sp. Leaf412]KQT31816.1 LacI family transcriptional regulator [Sphingomonas sp. Leaf412]